MGGIGGDINEYYFLMLFSALCQSLDLVKQYLTMHAVTESYIGNRLKFKADQCIFKC